MADEELVAKSRIIVDSAKGDEEYLVTHRITSVKNWAFGRVKDDGSVEQPKLDAHEYTLESGKRVVINRRYIKAIEEL